MRNRLLVAFVITASCGMDEPELEPSTSELAAQEDKLQTNGFPQNPLEAPRPTQGVARMDSAQLSRLSIGRFFKTTVAHTGAHRAIFRTSCSPHDTALYVVRRQTCTGTIPQCLMFKPVKDARFNDDCTGGGCVTRANSKIDMGAQSSGTHFYDAYVFSNTGSTFSCNLQRSLDGGASFSTIASSIKVGAQLVDVGAVARGASALDAFEVKTLANEGALGPASSDTEMMLFDVGTASPITATSTQQSAMIPLANDDGVAGADRDPRLGPGLSSGAPDYPPVACNDPCPPPPAPPRHFLAIGTKQDTGALQLDVDLVRTPSGANSSASFTSRALRGTWTCSTGTIALESGRYQAFIDVVSDKLYGDGEINDACGLDDEISCPSGPFYRGHGNTRAFQMKLQWQTPLGWSDVAGSQRDVPLASFGSGGLNRKIIDFEVAATPGTPRVHSLCVSAIYEPAVTFPGTWHTRKNPRYSELRLATLNAFHYENGEDENRNLSNLLLTRGRMVTGVGSQHDADQAPFQWAADIVAFQEEWSSVYADIHAEAERQSSLDWHFIYGMSKDSWGGYRRYSGLFAHDYLVDDTLEPPRDPENDAWRCAHNDPGAAGADADVRCYHHDAEDGGQDFFTYSVPGKTRVRRWGAEGAADQPIMVYNIQLEPWRRNTDNRKRELASLMDTIEEQLAFDPSMFNLGGSTSPTAAGNRMILIGDFNASAHDYGENRWMVKQLRDRFGWAVDVAAADRNSFANFYDMHEFQGRGMWDDAPYEPIYFQSTTDWKALSDTHGDPLTWWWGTAQYGTSFGPNRYWPYWARTNRGETGDQDHASAGGERNDMIVLVGRGWSNDDPVRSYVVMNTTTEGDSPFAMHDANGNVLGVDTWFSYSDTDLDVPGSRSHPTNVPHYRPNFVATDYDDGCTGSGCAVFTSDHVPVGARIRVGP